MALRRWLLENVAVYDIQHVDGELTDYKEYAERLGIEESWLRFMKPTPRQISQLLQITDKVDRERRLITIYPPKGDVHRWSRLCNSGSVKVVIIGQDPYHDGSACGIAFGTTQDRHAPPSLVTVFRELSRTVPNFRIPESGCLDAWCHQGVLLINTVFTVIKDRPGSHNDLGWQMLSDRAVQALSEQRDGLVFMLWGLQAQKKEYLIDSTKHLILKSSHPSPRAQGAKNPFIGNNHFVLANEYLSRQGSKVDWNVLGGTC